MLAGRLLGEKILPRHWLGLALGFAGVVIVLSPKLRRARRRRHPCDARPPLVIAVAGMSLGTIWQKRFGGGSDLVTGSALPVSRRARC